MATERITVTDRPMPLDEILWLHYRKEIPGFVEQTFENNPGLADKGPLLPVGTEFDVVVPDVIAGRVNPPLPTFMRK